MKNIGSEMSIQLQLLEVVERNTFKAEQEAEREKNEMEIIQVEANVVREKLEREKQQQREMEMEEMKLKHELDAATAKLKDLQRLGMKIVIGGRHRHLY